MSEHALHGLKLLSTIRGLSVHICSFWGHHAKNETCITGETVSTHGTSIFFVRQTCLASAGHLLTNRFFFLRSTQFCKTRDHDFSLSFPLFFFFPFSVLLFFPFPSLSHPSHFPCFFFPPFCSFFHVSNIFLFSPVFPSFCFSFCSFLPFLPFFLLCLPVVSFAVSRNV